MIIDKQVVASRFKAAESTYDQQAIVQQLINLEMLKGIIYANIEQADSSPLATNIVAKLLEDNFQGTPEVASIITSGINVKLPELTEDSALNLPDNLSGNLSLTSNLILPLKISDAEATAFLQSLHQTTFILDDEVFISKDTGELGEFDELGELGEFTPESNQSPAPKICDKNPKLDLEKDESLGSIKLIPINSGLEIGTGTGWLTQILFQNLEVQHWTYADLNAPTPRIQHILQQHPEYSYIQGDAEQMPFNQNYDLVVSGSTIQWFVEREVFWRRLAQAINPGALLAVSLFGPENFRELRELTGRGLAYPTLAELRKELEIDFDIIGLRSWELKVGFKSVKELLAHLRQSGVNGFNSDSPWTKTQLQDFYQEYEQKFTLEVPVTDSPPQPSSLTKELNNKEKQSLTNDKSEATKSSNRIKLYTLTYQPILVFARRKAS